MFAKELLSLLSTDKNSSSVPLSSISLKEHSFLEILLTGELLEDAGVEVVKALVSASSSSNSTRQVALVK